MLGISSVNFITIVTEVSIVTGTTIVFIWEVVSIIRSVLCLVIPHAASPAPPSARQTFFWWGTQLSGDLDFLWGKLDTCFLLIGNVNTTNIIHQFINIYGFLLPGPRFPWLLVFRFLLPDFLQVFLVIKVGSWGVMAQWCLERFLEACKTLSTRHCQFGQKYRVMTFCRRGLHLSKTITKRLQVHTILIKLIMHIAYMYLFLMKCIAVDVRLPVLFMINYHRYTKWIQKCEWKLKHQVPSNQFLKMICCWY